MESVIILSAIYIFTVWVCERILPNTKAKDFSGPIYMAAVLGTVIYYTTWVM